MTRYVEILCKVAAGITDHRMRFEDGSFGSVTYNERFGTWTGRWNNESKQYRTELAAVRGVLKMSREGAGPAPKKAI